MPFVIAIKYNVYWNKSKKVCSKTQQRKKYKTSLKQFKDRLQDEFGVSVAQGR